MVVAASGRRRNALVGIPIKMTLTESRHSTRGMDRFEIRFSLISATCRERNMRGGRQGKSTVRDTKVKALELNKGAHL